MLFLLKRSLFPDFRRTGALGLLAVLLVLPQDGLRPQVVSDTVRVTINGVVLDAASGFGVPGAVVRLADTDFLAETSEIGTFTLSDLLRGAYVIIVEAPGYETKQNSIRVLRSGEITLSLEPESSVSRMTTSSSRDNSAVLGQILEMETGDPVEGAEVLLQGAEGFRVTDSDGRFEFPSVRPGRAAFSVAYLGRAPLVDSVEVAPGTTVELEVRLGIDPVEVAPLSILATARDPYLEDMGFYNRRGRGYNGQVITQEEIEERAPRTMGDLLVTVPGVRVDYGGAGQFQVRMRRAVSFDNSAESGCVPLVHMDDVPVEVGWLENIQPDRVAGMEIYRGAGAPIQYNNPCGVILVWTRRGERGGG
jgi:hypothetical protein